MPATQTTNLGLNKPDRQDLVSVVTDINDNMDTLDGAIGALPTGRTLQGQINTLKPMAITLDPVTNANGAVTVTTTDARVTEDLKAVFIEVGTPETFKAPIRITTGNGTVELYCANAVGSSTVVVTFEMATPLDSADPQPASVTSTEFDILAGRIGTLSQLTTTNKQDIVSAVNELDGDIATLNGNMENYHTWTKILDVTTTVNANYDVNSSVTYPTYGISEIMFTLQRVSNGRTFASTIVPNTQFIGGAVYAFGSYNLFTGSMGTADSIKTINAVAIMTDDTHIEVAINANDEAIKARVYVR